jgi:serine/threonine protein kinase
MSDRGKKRKVGELLSDLRELQTPVAQFVASSREPKVLAKTKSAFVAVAHSVADEKFAVKVLATPKTQNQPYLHRYTCELEFKFATFLSSPEFSEHCAYFCRAFAWRISSDALNSQCKLIKKSVAQPILVMEACDLTFKQFLSACEFEEQIMSVVLQIVFALLCMKTVGISHNDLYTRNIMIKTTPATVNQHIIDAKQSLCFNTFGFSVRICDFGLASCYNKPDERGPLNLFYFPDSKLSRPLSLFRAEHVLAYKGVQQSERDFASVLADVYRHLTMSHDEIRDISRNVCNYICHFAEKLENLTPTRPEEGVEFAKSMLEQKTIADFMATDRLFPSAKPDRIYAAPTAAQADKLEAQFGAVFDKLVVDDVNY